MSQVWSDFSGPRKVFSSANNTNSKLTQIMFFHRSKKRLKRSLWRRLMSTELDHPALSLEEPKIGADFI